MILIGLAASWSERWKEIVFVVSCGQCYTKLHNIYARSFASAIQRFDLSSDNKNIAFM